MSEVEVLFSQVSYNISEIYVKMSSSSEKQKVKCLAAVGNILHQLRCLVSTKLSSYEDNSGSYYNLCFNDDDLSASEGEETVQSMSQDEETVLSTSQRNEILWDTNSLLKCDSFLAADRVVEDWIIAYMLCLESYSGENGIFWEFEP